MEALNFEKCEECGVMIVIALFDMHEGGEKRSEVKRFIYVVVVYESHVLGALQRKVTDLLAQEDSSRSSSDDKQKKHVSLMEDGKGCVVLRGLEEEVVYSANDIYALLERGSSKRRTADTLLNKRSTADTLLRKSLWEMRRLRDGRAREAGEINKSLLTLGRVINALVEHSSHIPYRYSELTRLLRDSLGGKTKTCISATISPSAHSLEETLSTLDYAYRAKNIKNKPEENQKLSKAVLLKYLYLELERTKEGLHTLLSHI
ncbi:hypothetical protein F2Q70_00027333 [Brassica cretica]|uniref:Kinesin motor domain-containing protein n=1 Tax=Brassica cretica TaxID=69181 RepID=A0A8S9I825_BRACR|nr:hypothetical protein F2Q68_00026889 [Brassica cretica]KAF2601448.1 hypothetical protein F2Q70_00027333 [Brassica cretica]